jgi:hypothetical protein
MTPPALRHRIACLLIVAEASLGTGGCARWEVQPLRPQVVLHREHPSRIRLVRTDSTRVEFKRTLLQEGSITGVQGRQARSIPLDSVAYISIRRSNHWGPLLLVGGALSAGLIVLIGATYNQ